MQIASMAFAGSMPRLIRTTPTSFAPRHNGCVYVGMMLPAIEAMVGKTLHNHLMWPSLEMDRHLLRGIYPDLAIRTPHPVLPCRHLYEALNETTN